MVIIVNALKYNKEMVVEHTKEAIKRLVAFAETQRNASVFFKIDEYPYKIVPAEDFSFEEPYEEFEIRLSTTKTAVKDKRFLSHLSHTIGRFYNYSYIVDHDSLWFTYKLAIYLGE